MRCSTLLYHDAIDGEGVAAGDVDASGFPGAGPALYKLPVAELERHLAALAEARAQAPSTVYDVLRDVAAGARGVERFLLTFDDGGASACPRIADLLEVYGWRGHFFVTAGRIGTPGFLDPPRIRELHARGHVVGSHSYSHPPRMSRCSPAQLADEWTRSCWALADILGVAVDVASVPGGYTSRRVVTAAARSGVRALFTSEPVRHISRRAGCLVLGRYAVRRGTSPAMAAAFSAPRLNLHQARQYVFWNLKKLIKAMTGDHYLRIRRALASTWR